MTDVRFYHLTRSRLEDALPVMLQRTLERDARAVVRLGSAARLAELDEVLWTFSASKFIPHGSEKAGFAEDQPVWLTLGEDNPGGAKYLFSTDGAGVEGLDSFEVCALLFDGRIEADVQAARVKWKAIKSADASHELSYWQQNERGGWEQKA